MNVNEFHIISPHTLQIFVSCEALAEGLKHNSTLTNLNLEENNIGDTGAQAWCLVRMVSTLQIFVCCQALAEGLKHNSTVTNLNLKNNDIGPEKRQAWCLVRMVRMRKGS